MKNAWIAIALGLVLILSALAWGQQGARFVPFADVTVTNAATVVRAANAARVGLVCTNNDAAVNVRVGDSTVTASTGVRLKAGNSITITATIGISMISEGANVTVSCTEELR